MPKRHSGFRNPVARSPLLRKGGPHQQSKTGQRVQTRISTQSLAEEWLDERDDLHQEEGVIGEQQLPDSFVAFGFEQLLVKAPEPRETNRVPSLVASDPTTGQLPTSALDQKLRSLHWHTQCPPYSSWRRIQ